MFTKFASTPKTILFICLFFVGNSMNGDLTLYFFISSIHSLTPNILTYSHLLTEVDLAKVNNNLLIYKSGNTSHNLAHLILRNWHHLLLMCSLPVGSMKPVSLAFLLFVCLFHALWTYAVSSTYQLCNLSDSSFLLTYKGGDNYIYFIRWLWDSSDKICHKCLQHNTWQTLRWCSNWETVWYGSICCVVAVLLLSLLLLLS